MTRKIITLWVAAQLLGCGYNVYSPPTRGMPLQTVAPVQQGRTGVQLEVGTAGATFGPDLVVVSGRVRRLLVDELEGSLEANVVHVLGSEQADAHPNVYSVRAGAKLVALDWLAFSGGLGQGYSEGGAFVSPDLGVIVAYENPTLVPFASLRGYLSQPLGAREVVLLDPDDEDDEERRVDTPETTLGVTGTLGLRVPLGEAGDERGSLLIGVSATEMSDFEEREAFIGADLGVEVVY